MNNLLRKMTKVVTMNMLPQTIPNGCLEIREDESCVIDRRVCRIFGLQEVYHGSLQEILANIAKDFVPFMRRLQRNVHFWLKRFGYLPAVVRYSRISYFSEKKALKSQDSDEEDITDIEVEEICC